MNATAPYKALAVVDPSHLEWGLIFLASETNHFRYRNWRQTGQQFLHHYILYKTWVGFVANLLANLEYLMGTGPTA